LSEGIDPFGFSWGLPIWLRKPLFMRVGIPWISLDSLVRIESYQWVARDFPRKIFRGRLGAKAGRGSAIDAFREGGIVHGASLLQFLIVSNQLSFDTVEHAKLAVSIFPLHEPAALTGERDRPQAQLSRRRATSSLSGM
jgi:hypothetical protein